MTPDLRSDLFLIEFISDVSECHNLGLLQFFQTADIMTISTRHPFTPWAIIDLISILPAFSILSSGFKLLRLLRVLRTFRVFKVFKALRYSKSMVIIINVMKNSKEALFAVYTSALGYIIISLIFITLRGTLLKRSLMPYIGPQYH